MVYNKKKVAIGIVALIGFLTTVKLAFIYYNANFNPYALSSFCSVNDFIDCDGIAKTTESQFLGVPLALWGMFLYAFIGLLLFVDKLKNIKFLKFFEVFKNPMSYIAALGLISFAISMILFGLSLFSIKKLCILCFLTYLLNLLIGAIAAEGTGFKKAFTDSVKDLIDGVKIKKYAIALSVVVLIAAALLTYTKTSYILAPQAKNAAEFKEFVKAKTNKYAVSGNLLGKENATVIVYSYTDYRCPICSAYNIMIHKLVREFKNVRIVHKNYPLDTACNKYLRQEFHKGACMMAKFAIAAEKQGKFWDLNSKLFEKQPKNEAEIIEIAKKLKLDTDRLVDDANSIETMHQIQADIDEAVHLGINGTPTTVINGKVHIGIMPYDKFKEWFIDAGAKRK